MLLLSENKNVGLIAPPLPAALKPLPPTDIRARIRGDRHYTTAAAKFNRGVELVNHVRHALATRPAPFSSVGSY